MMIVVIIAILGAVGIAHQNYVKRDTDAVQKIHASRLTMSDVDGNHLPPDPDIEQNDATVEGIDANQNGIRDDVELAIFDKYPGDKNIKIRAASLQYAKALQMMLTEVFSEETWRAAVEEKGRAYGCVSRESTEIKESLRNRDNIEDLVINTVFRKNTSLSITKYSVSLTFNQDNDCDI